jgi:hypothetical protein
VNEGQGKVWYQTRACACHPPDRYADSGKIQRIQKTMLIMQNKSDVDDHFDGFEDTINGFEIPLMALRYVTVSPSVAPLLARPTSSRRFSFLYLKPAVSLFYLPNIPTNHGFLQWMKRPTALADDFKDVSPR